MAANVNYNTIISALKTPIYSTLPYIPAKTYPNAVPKDTIIDNNFSILSKSFLSYGTDLSKAIILELATSSTIMFDVIRGDIPSSINEFLFDAKTTLIQYRGSAPVDTYTPYKGILQHNKYIKSVIAVHNTFSRNYIDDVGLRTDGINSKIGLKLYSKVSPI